MVEEQGLWGLYHNCFLAVIGPDGRPAFGFEGERALCYSNFSARLGRKGGQKLDYEGMAEADVRAGRASILFAHPEVIISKAFRELVFFKLYQKNADYVVADEARCNVDW